MSDGPSFVFGVLCLIVAIAQLFAAAQDPAAFIPSAIFAALGVALIWRAGAPLTRRRAKRRMRNH